MSKPECGWCTKGKVVRVIDGDTLDIEISRVIRIRLLSIDTPELNTVEGKEAAAFVKDLLEKQEDITLFIPSQQDLHLTHVLTLNRVLGRIFLDDGSDLSDRLKEGGFIKNTSSTELAYSIPDECVWNYPYTDLLGKDQNERIQ